MNLTDRDLFAAIDTSPSGVANIYSETAEYGELLDVARSLWDRGIGHYYACGPRILVARDESKLNAELQRSDR